MHLNKVRIIGVLQRAHQNWTTDLINEADLKLAHRKEPERKELPGTVRLPTDECFGTR